MAASLGDTNYDTEHVRPYVNRYTCPFKHI